MEKGFPGQWAQSGPRDGVPRTSGPQHQVSLKVVTASAGDGTPTGDGVSDAMQSSR
jgi:hypothetical protein